MGAVFLFVLLFVVFFELASLAIVRSGFLPRDLPTYSWRQIYSEFWIGNHPIFGRWHGPHTEYHHVRSCFSANYKANEYGMRDSDRKLRDTNARTVVLGDSFVEGYGLNQSDRLSDLLERISGRPHLNFGTSGYFGPTEYGLVYRHLAKQFSHDAILIGIYPGNDFIDDDPEIWKQAGRYQPFLVGEYPDYQYVYSGKLSQSNSWTLARTLKGFFREFSHSYGLMGGLFKGAKMNAINRQLAQSSAPYSGYYDFTEAQWQRLRYALEELRREAPEKQISVLLFPSPVDRARYRQEGQAPLQNKMIPLSEVLNFQLLDPLPWLAAQTLPDNDFYLLPCDHHLSAEGSRRLAEWVWQALKGNQQ